MKLTKTQLKQIIKKELQELQSLKEIWGPGGYNPDKRVRPAGGWPSSETKPKLGGYPTSAQFKEENFLALLGPLEQQLANMLGRAETKSMTMLPDRVEAAYTEFRDLSDKLLKAMRGIDADADPEKYSRTGPYARKEPEMGVY